MSRTSGLPHARSWGILKPAARARDTARARRSIVDGTDDERVRRLQRIAYGAHASAEERGAALDELGRLERADAESAEVAPTAAARDASREASAVVESDAIVDDPATAPRRRSRGFALRAGVIAGAGALVIGVVAGFAVGWQSRPNDAHRCGIHGQLGPGRTGPPPARRRVRLDAHRPRDRCRARLRTHADGCRHTRSRESTRRGHVTRGARRHAPAGDEPRWRRPLRRRATTRISA